VGHHALIVVRRTQECQSALRSPVILVPLTAQFSQVERAEWYLGRVLDAALIDRASHPDLRVGHAILAAELDRLKGTYALISQAEPLAVLDPAIAGRASATLLAESLEEAHLAATAGSLPSVDHIVGIGGGMAMDMAKYVAWSRGLPLVLAPSIISVDASVTNTVAVRRGGHVVYEGFVIAQPIVVDLDLVAAAPARLNRAGVGDLLSIQTGRWDWALGSRAGRIPFDASVDAAAAGVLERLLELAPEVADVTDAALEAIIRAYAEVNALVLRVGHSGPEEGSEHHFAYAVEAHTGRSFVHGELIGLGVVLMSGLQGNDQAGAVRFLDRCMVRWRPAQLDLDPDTLRAILLDLPRFVHSAGLPYSIIDEAPPDAGRVDRLLDPILAAPAAAQPPKLRTTEGRPR
jgi:glycerol-1-phosphate dehydrogenase [NAD(P)+]